MEWWSQRKNLRGEMLERATRRLFGEEADPNPAVTNAYLQHPLIRTLRDGSRMPSYIPATIFAKALRDILARKRGPSEDALHVSSSLRQTLDALVPDGSGQRAADGLPSEASLAEWYDQVMERVSGTYKREARSRVLVLAIGVTLVMNADTVTLTTNLWQNPTLRAYVVERARVRLEQGPPLETVEYTDPDNPTPTPPVASERPQTVCAAWYSWEGPGPRRRSETPPAEIACGF